MNEHETTTTIFIYLNGWEIAKVMRGETVVRLQGRRPRADVPQHQPERVAVPTVFQDAFKDGEIAL